MGITKFIAAAALLLASFGASAQTYRIWADTTTPGGNATSLQYQLGTVFNSSVAGYVIGIRWYKQSTDTGTHTVNLWSAGATMIGGPLTVTGETASGWQTMMLPTPVAIAANTNYVVSYHYNGTGSFSFTSGTGTVSSPPLSTAGSLYIQTTSSTTYPNTAGGGFYYADVIFVKKSNTYILIPNN